MTEKTKLFIFASLNPMSVDSWFLILSSFCRIYILDSSQEC